MCYKKSLLGYLLVFIFNLTVTVLNASEIQSFGLLGYEGFLDANSLKDDNFSGVINGISQDREQLGLQQELNLLFHSFIYHPNFIRFDFGGALIRRTNDTKNSKINASNEESKTKFSTDTTSLDYQLKFLFFERKSYPFTLFYKKRQPNLKNTAENGLSTESTQYGLDLTWKAPITFRLYSSHIDSQGTAFLQTVDESTDVTRLSAKKILKRSGSLDLIVNHSVAKSKSGSTLNPILGTLNTTNSIEYLSVHHFDDLGKYNATMRANYEQQRDSFEFDRSSLSTTFDWKINKNLRSNYSYQYNALELVNIKTSSQQLNGNIQYNSNNGVSANSLLTTGIVKSIGAKNQTYGISNAINYVKSFTGGNFSTTARIIVNQTNNTTSLTSVFFVQPVVVLSLEEFVLLQNNITVSSIRVYQTKNKSIEYNPNTDYEIIKRGGVTSIRLRADSQIPKDNQNNQVRIEYSYDPGSDNKLLATTKDISTRLDLLEYFYVEGQYLKYDLNVQEGIISDTEVTYRNESTYGGGVDYPFYDLFIIGGSSVLTKTDQNIISNDQKTDRLYLQFNLFSSTSLHLAQTKTKIDYTVISNNLGSVTDIDQISNIAVLTFHPTAAINMSLSYDHTTDVGSIQKRTFTQSKVLFNWRYRKIFFELTGSLYKEQDGNNLRENASVYIDLLRTF